MNRLAAAITFACLAATARADDITPPPIRVSCIPPLLWHTNRCECPDGRTPVETGYATFVCPAPPAPGVTAPTCTITISHPVSSPATTTLTKSPECDDAALELALAIALARRLGAP